MTLTNTEILGRKSVPAPLFITKGQCRFEVVGVVVIVAVMQMAVATAAALVVTIITASFFSCNVECHYN
jgi:hypothetical protein